jgi:hypothetical protein
VVLGRVVRPALRCLAGAVLIKVTTAVQGLWLGVAARLRDAGEAGFTPDLVTSAALLVVTVTVLLRSGRGGFRRFTLLDARPAVADGPSDEDQG